MQNPLWDTTYLTGRTSQINMFEPLPSHTKYAIIYADPPSFLERFWSKVDLSNTSGCWNWTASTNHKGYGQINSGKKVLRAHRVSYEMTNGLIPKGLNVLHSCDNRKCVNPAHLRIGTSKENTNDMDSRGRRVNSPQPGENNAQAKLTEKEVLMIRTQHAQGVSQRALGREYGVDNTTISLIVTRKKWKHI